jgi:hypothetical protein
MEELYGSGNELRAEDTDCRALRRSLREAQDLVREGGFLDPSERQRLESRYQDLARFADALGGCARVQGPLQQRVVDILAGLAGPGAPHNPQAAALLLWSKGEASQAIAGHASACQAALSLPEQTFRVWAFWRLGLDYYHAPDGAEEVWQAAGREWGGNDGPLRRAQAGQEFPSFAAFAYFALAAWHLGGKPGNAPAGTFGQLKSDLSFHELVRNGKAHALSLTTARQREKYFDLIDRWLRCAVEACPERVTVATLRMTLEPLPAVEPEGALRW